MYELCLICVSAPPFAAPSLRSAATPSSAASAPPSIAPSLRDSAIPSAAASPLDMWGGKV